MQAVFAFLIAGFLCVVAVLAAIPFAYRFGIESKRDFRRTENSAIPLVGGVAIFTSVFLTLAFFDHSYHWYILLPAAAVFVLGFADDYLEFKAWPKLLIQLLAVILFVAMVPEGAFLLEQVGMGAVAARFISGFLILGLINCFNMIDGLDGLAGGAAVIIAVALGFMVPSELQVLVFATAGGALGFLFFNRPNARIYLGDSGSTMLGFLLSSLAMVVQVKSSAASGVLIPFFLFALCEVDGVFAIVRRIRSDRPLMAGDKDHIHHKLQRIGLSKWQSVILIWMTVVATAGVSLLLYHSPLDWFSMVASAGIALILILILRGVFYFEERLTLGTKNFASEFWKNSDLLPETSTGLIEPRQVIQVDLSKYFEELHQKTPKDMVTFLIETKKLLENCGDRFNFKWHFDNESSLVGFSDSDESLEIRAHFSERFESIIDSVKVRKSQALVPEGVAFYSGNDPKLQAQAAIQKVLQESVHRLEIG